MRAITSRRNDFSSIVVTSNQPWYTGLMIVLMGLHYLESKSRYMIRSNVETELKGCLVPHSRDVNLYLVSQLCSVQDYSVVRDPPISHYKMALLNLPSEIFQQVISET